MKRRALLALGLGGFTAAVGRRYWPQAPASNYLANTAAGNDALINFMAAGDVGTGERAQHAVAQAMIQHQRVTPSPLVLLTGDNIYENGEIEKVGRVFEQPYAELLRQNTKFYAVLGNHDVRTNHGEDQLNYPGYNMAGRYYTFTQQAVQFFALDTTQALDSDDKSPWRTQLAWFETALRRSQAPWKIVFAHHPVYSSGQHGSQQPLIDDLSPLFAEHGVQLYINGHDHNYERTEPIDGTTYITSGNGAKLRSVGRSDWTAAASSQLGFTAFSVYADRIEVNAIDTNNAAYDTVSIAMTGAQGAFAPGARSLSLA
ncbi:metallophosphoesterase [Leptolyngbya sp. CCNP1308]|uniref:metallophosphoesterase n=1 Tax=Leptolyngbya sp. CCNP1308 TaxID=3110255 RepID=UPI002B2092F5|nr:metallophosphoesterase [Leptolyngbya sp. CCNP1308]MEA5449527.1 metallophosphoesterase [Leptolyngbya sp. CCNP1308]